MEHNGTHLPFNRSPDHPNHQHCTTRGTHKGTSRLHSTMSLSSSKGVTFSVLMIVAMFLCQAQLTESISSTSCPDQCVCSNVTATKAFATRPFLTIDCSNGSLQGFIALMWSDGSEFITNKNITAGMSKSANNGSKDESSEILKVTNSIHRDSNETLLQFDDSLETNHRRMTTGSDDRGEALDINIDLSFNNISSLQALGLFDWKSAPMVKRLNLSNNRIETLNGSFFQSFSNLVILDLSNNIIDEFVPSVFQHISSLKFLYLHNNRITSILLQQQPVDLLFASSLTHLDLSHNRLLNLSANTFTTFPMLSSLKLSGNNIAVIDQFAFTGLPHLQVLFLSKNNISSLNYPVFQDTSLVSLWLDNMPHLSHLGHNGFQGLTHLQYLNLSQNSQVQFLHYDIFSDLQSLQILDLSGNAIQQLSSLTFRNNHQLQNVFLKAVPLSCQCTNAWLNESLHNSLFHDASHLECFDIQDNQTVPIAEAIFNCNNVSIPHMQSTLSVSIGSALSLQCKQLFSSDEDILIWTTPRGHIYYYHHFYPNASQHLLSPADVQPKAPFHKNHFWHQSSSYYSDLSSNKKRIQVLSDGSLFIDYVLRTDAGSYKCIIKNSNFNDSGTLVVQFSYNISGEIKIIACVVGILCALGLFTLNVIYVVITWLARRLVNKRRREHIRAMLENLNSYKSTQITRIYENYSGQLTRVRNRYHVQRDRLHNNYTMQVERVKRGCSHQAEKVKDNYNNRLTQLREYSTCQIVQIREMATNQIGRIRDYGSLQLDRLRETYKLQHQHMMKLLDTMNLDNCRSIVETECMRTESMMYDLDLLSQEDVRMESPFSVADDDDSEYNTATSSPMLSVGSQEHINAPSYQTNYNESGDQYKMANGNGAECVAESDEILKVTRSSNEMDHNQTNDIQIEMNTVLHLQDNVQLDAKEVWTYGEGDKSTHKLYTNVCAPGGLQQTCVEREDQPALQINDTPQKGATVKVDKSKSMAGVSLPSIDLGMLQQSDPDWDVGFMEQEASPTKMWQGPPPLFQCDDCKDCATVHLYNNDAEDEEEEEKTETDTMV